ncbi:MAG: hypothetical protein A2X45_05400 [Lentisphaerae bacterium GWF2_50_93]|nr:MAG: hypothetical protein A2X45_05400 [Lentisphaerae bacterium GWF2_50_93]
MNLILSAFIVLSAFALGYLMRGPAMRPEAGSGVAESAVVSKPADMTCSMHPQIRQPKPGKCPLCGMDLISAGSDSGDSCGPRELKLSEAAEKLADIETAPVERKFVPAEIRMLGKIAYNEDTLCYVNARFSGRIDKLFVKSAGIPVKKGERIAEVYSSELLVIQQELLQAKRFLESKPDDVTAISFFNSIREKNLISGFTEDQINEIIRKGKGTGADRMSGTSPVFGVLLTITSPISGVVVGKGAVTGKFFEKGEILFTIADLSRVWINVEAYEADLPWLKYGQEVEFTSDACPGRKFNGRVSLIQPILDETTRTVKVRLSAENKEGRLKPGMFVHAIVRAKIAEDGKVVDSSLAGKWISPMHPEIIRDAPGKCDICGVDLVTAESLGLAGEKEKTAVPPLVIPASAALLTGKRAVVYVSLPGRKGAYECREIVLGPRAGDFFIVESGLKEGEKVVKSGSFKIDSSLQILAKTSMMKTYAGAAPEPMTEIPAAKDGQAPSDEILDTYIEVQKALFAENMAIVLKNAPKLDAKYSANLAASKDIREARKSFAQISKLLYGELACSENNLKKPLYKIFCPKVFEGRGAYWIQDSEKVQNPYFGPAMPDSGEVKETIGGGK